MFALQRKLPTDRGNWRLIQPFDIDSAVDVLEGSMRMAKASTTKIELRVVENDNVQRPLLYWFIGIGWVTVEEYCEHKRKEYQNSHSKGYTI